MASHGSMLVRMRIADDHFERLRMHSWIQARRSIDRTDPTAQSPFILPVDRRLGWVLRSNPIDLRRAGTNLDGLGDD